MTQKDRANVILIGMPGAGKSTVGVILAKYTSREFIDSDVVIQVTEGRPLQDIVDGDGYMALRAAEERVLLSLTLHNHVIATGGSAVYSARAMQHLKQSGSAVYLKTHLATIHARVRDFETRGIARHPGQDMDSLLKERAELYRRYADITIDCDNLNQDEVARKVIARV